MSLKKACMKLQHDWFADAYNHKEVILVLAASLETN